MLTRTALSLVGELVRVSRSHTALLVPWVLMLTWSLISVVPGYAQTYVPYQSPGYRYLVVPQGGGPAGFQQPGFDDSSWNIGNAAFGLFGCGTLWGCPLDPTAQTCWPVETDILLRKTFVLPPTATDVKVAVAIDNDIQVFVNGMDISNGLQQNEGCASRERYIFPVPDGILTLGGTNVLAVRARDRGGDSYVDVEVRSGNPETGTLTGEELSGSPTGPATLNCIPQGTSTAQFSASGDAFGQYVGTFTENVQLTIDSTTNTLLTLNSSFTINSSGSTVTGTKSLIGGFGFCDPSGFLYIQAGVEYDATIHPSNMNESGVGSVFVFVQIDPSTNQPTFGFFQEEFVTANSSSPAPAMMTLTPPEDVNPVGTSHTVIATVLDGSGDPVPNVTVRFMVEGSASATGLCTTNASGQCPFTYPGPALPGADAITAFTDSDNDGTQDAGEPTAAATKAWIFPTSTPGLVTGGGQTFNSDMTGLIAFGFNARDSGIPSGECTVVDQTTTPRTFIKCTSVAAIVVTTTPVRSAQIFGNGTINGAPMTYRIDVTDAAEPGAFQDRFEILTSTRYQAGGLLVHGNVQVHR